MNADLLDIISSDLNVDLRDIMQRMSKHGYMNDLGDSYAFSHEAVASAAFTMMNERDRRNNQMRFGLALCSHALNADHATDDDIFFKAINLVNMGGRSVIEDPSQLHMVAKLNLKAGRLAINLYDYNTAFKLFEHGISYLVNDHWKTDYKLSLDLHDEAAEAASVTSRGKEVEYYTREVVANATSSDDKLNCLHAISKVVTRADMKDESINTLFGILEELGEAPLRQPGDDQLVNDTRTVNALIKELSDEEILNFDEIRERRVVTLMKVYNVYMLRFRKSSLIAAASLRMVELTLNNGLCSLSPMAFVHYAEVLSSADIPLALRVGELALKLLEKSKSSRCKAQVFFSVYQTVMWLKHPFQAIANYHEIGYKAGMQVGDVISSSLNLSRALMVGYIAGQPLRDIREKMKEIFKQRGMESCGHLSYANVCALIEGQHLLDATQIDGIPGKPGIIARARESGDSHTLLLNLVHHLLRVVCFRQYDNISASICVSDMIFEKKKVALRPLFTFAVFTEGIVFFQYSRQTIGEESLKWRAKGRNVLEKIRTWNEYCRWNFENKCLLLDAEDASLSGETERAESLYTMSIKSAIRHNFKHEEAIASELAGLFLSGRGQHGKAFELLRHSANCFTRWGALAVARRVEASIEAKYGHNFSLPGGCEGWLESALSAREGPLKKRLNTN
jgi:hypothetical protein